MLVLDIEASGLNFEKHSIVSLGALDLEHPENRFYAECKVWDGAHIEDEALEVNGFSKEEILDPNKMTEALLIEKFIGWSSELHNRTMAGQNVSFDRDMSKQAAHRAGLNWNFAHRTIDTHSLCWMHMINHGVTPPLDEEHRRSALNLDAVLNYCGIPDEPQPHNALTGAMCHAEVISRLLYGKKLLPVFDQFEIPWA